jgi:hypothetical protein
MSRPCSVCNHPQCAEIDKALITGDSFRIVSERFGVTEASALRHKTNHLSKTVARVVKERERKQEALVAEVVEQTEQAAERRQIDISEQIDNLFTKANLMLDATHAWLQDPDNTDRYDLGPRAEEITVTYEDRIEEEKRTTYRRGKAKLSELLAEAMGDRDDRSWTKIEVKHADPRNLHLQSIAQLKAIVELLAKLRGELDDRPVINVIASPEWAKLSAVIFEVLGNDYPEAGIALAARLEALEGGA